MKKNNVIVNTALKIFDKFGIAILVIYFFVLLFIVIIGYAFDDNNNISLPTFNPSINSVNNSNDNNTGKFIKMDFRNSPVVNSYLTYDSLWELDFYDAKDSFVNDFSYCCDSKTYESNSTIIYTKYNSDLFNQGISQVVLFNNDNYDDIIGFAARDSKWFNDDMELFNYFYSESISLYGEPSYYVCNKDEDWDLLMNKFEAGTIDEDDYIGYCWLVGNSSIYVVSTFYNNSLFVQNNHGDLVYDFYGYEY